MLGSFKILVLDCCGCILVFVSCFFSYLSIYLPAHSLIYFSSCQGTSSEFSKENVLRSHLPVTILYFDLIFKHRSLDVTF